MKKKTGVILSSVAAIAVSASVIAGSTYALFTSEDKVDITVSSANVEVSASVTEAELNRPVSINADTYAATYAEEGTALSDVSGKEISLDDIQPGDKITLNLLIESESTVNFKYRVSLVKTGGDQNLYENLLVGIDGSYYSDYVSAWTDFSEITEAGKPITVKQSTVEILMPAYLGNEYKNLSCNVALKLEAVQGNVDKNAEAGTAKKVYPVYSQDDLTAALAGVGEGETIVVMQKWNGVTINMSDATEAVEFGVKGCDVGTLTVNAPLASIHYDIGKTEVVEITAVANNSFHVSGEIAALNVSEGRVVFEEGAKVPTATFNVAADKSAKMEVLKGAEVGFIDDNNSAGTIVIDAVNGKVSEVAEALIEKTEGYVVVSTAEEFEVAIANGGNISLAADLELSKIINVVKTTHINGNGHSIVSSASKILWIDSSDIDVNLSNIRLLRNGNNDVQRAVQVNQNITGIRLNINDCTLEASYYAVNICNGADVELNINNSEITGWGAINAWSAGYSIRVNNSILRGVNDKGYDANGWNDFGTVVIEGDTTYKTEDAAESVDIELRGCTIIAESKTGNIQKCILFNSQSKGNQVDVIDCEFILENENCLLYIDNGTDNELNIIN